MKFWSSPPLILASRSPRRKELLTSAGYHFEVMPSDENAEDAIRTTESPLDYVKRLAFQKAENVAEKLTVELSGFSPFVIGCDTVVVCDHTILGKPQNRSDAGRMLRLLAGTQHRVCTGLCVLAIDRTISRLEHDETILEMTPLSKEEIEEYLDSGLWQGKAGAFGYQDRNSWLRIVQGSESNVVGLPLELLKRILNEVKTTRRTMLGG